VDPIGVASAEVVVGEAENCEPVVGNRMGKFSDRPLACRLAEAVVLVESAAGLAGAGGSLSGFTKQLTLGSSCNDMGRVLAVMMLGRRLDRGQGVFDKLTVGPVGRVLMM